jgi:hypothetical protein
LDSFLSTNSFRPMLLILDIVTDVTQNLGPYSKIGH